MERRSFFAIVGPEGSGKSTLLRKLEQAFSNKALCAFLRDSSSDNMSHALFTEGVTQIMRGGIHALAHPKSQLLLSWSRLYNVIYHDIVPCLKSKQLITIDGFGCTILCHALSCAESEDEQKELIALHKSCIEHLVIGRVPPPIYIWLNVDPHVAHARHQREGKYIDTVRVERINSICKLYGTIPGQTVIEVDANQDANTVFDEVLRIIQPEILLETAI